VRGQTSVKFPTSGSAVAPERVAEAKLIGASGEERIADLSVSSESLLFRHRPTTAGQRVPAGGALQAAGDSAAVAATVDRFHAAVVAGDSALALSLLAADAVVLESGGIETRDEFRSHHLAADIAFAQAVKSERGPMRVVVRGDAAWVTSVSTTTGEYRGRQVNSSGAELMVLSRTPQGWRIAAIHWSSRTRRPASG
jgi:ketosteroid isomerase-like protein